ncbi:chemosensory receptor A [Elysia marginata]|uniref:Chemosensory receptor A n=1 Tax=Elysia marginata TaxID=1093978 RepID=A0AAV4HEQ4_9GAST|nr:chemosensory receptor A [Elysia marginata]
MERSSSHNLEVRATNETSASVTNHVGSWIQTLGSVYLEILTAYFSSLVSVGTFGVIGNILVILVYVKMGFSSSIYISYTALAVSDLFCSLANIAHAVLSIGITPGRPNGQMFVLFGRIFGGYPSLAFSRISSLLTAWVSLERCFCVVFPTRVKLMINRAVTQTVLVLIFILGMTPLVFLYLAYRHEWKFNPETNTTTFTLVYDKGIGQTMIQGVALFLLTVVYPLFSCVTVTLCSTILVIKLRQSSRWKRLNTSGSGVSADTGSGSKATNQSAPHKKNTMSKKEVRVTRVVLLVDGVFLVCSLPMVGQLLAIATVPGYSGTGYLNVLYRVNAMVAVVATQLNSSLNVVIFAVSVQKFRFVLIQILSGQFCKN